jgi:hypothetical protein
MKHLLRWTGVVSLLAVLPGQAQDAKVGAESLKYSRDFYSKVHMVAIATLDFGAGGTAQFKYDRYPSGGPERILAGDGSFARNRVSANWLTSDDWGETGKPVDAQTAKRLNNYVGLVEDRLGAEPLLRFVTKRDKGERVELVFEGPNEDSGEAHQFVFGKFKKANDENSDTPWLFSEFSGSMRLGARQASVKITFSHLISVKLVEAKDESVATKPPSAPEKADSIGVTGSAVKLLDGKFTIVVPNDYVREPDDPKNPKSLAKFGRNGEGGVWGEVLRGTQGLTPKQLPDYLKKRVVEYTKGFDWLPEDTQLTWIKKEIVTINGRPWADWRYIPTNKGAKSYKDNPLYTRFLTTSYKGQLLEITFTSNLNKDPAVKTEIDRIMDSIRLEE